MKKIFKIFILTLILALIFSYNSLTFATSNNSMQYKFNLTQKEQQWLSQNKDRTFVLALDPYSGPEYFKYDGQEKGYLISLVNDMSKDLNLKIKLEATKNWGEVYSGLQTGSVDILFGANATKERKTIMAFTKPINKIPYAIISKKNSNIHTIGDIDNKVVGFMNGDAVEALIPSIYKNIEYNDKLYASQEEGITALRNNEVDAFITSGGPVVYDYIYRYPELTYAFKISKITSDLTLSTRKEDKILADILDKEIQNLGQYKISQMINQAEKEYNLKIMNLTEQEKQWLKNDGKAVVGVTKNYLPFDFYDNGTYKGISGEIIKEISKETGIQFTNVYGDFDNLYNKLNKGEIDVLNVAKTEDRKKDILFPQPYSTERDIIVGRKDSDDVRDIFGLEGKKVAVIKGFWHYEYLKKNLTNVQIIETNNIQESLTLVHQGKADYLIENPTVVRYYTEELQLYDLVEKGTTSADSYLYYGIAKDKPELASIINKAIPLIEIEEAWKKGYEEVPHYSNKNSNKLFIIIIIGLGVVLVLIIIYVIKLIDDLIKEKNESELLRQREHLLYTDSLTNVYNRNYLNSKIMNDLDIKQYPQTIVVIDMNNLKIINDNYGHQAGDEALKLLASILIEVCYPNSLIFRMGGDEFQIILENTDEQRAKEIIKNIKDAIEERNIQSNESYRIKISAAFGYATRHSAEINFEDMIKFADRKMYEDKEKYHKE